MHQFKVDFEQRILHGLSCEWDNALLFISFDLRRKMKMPMFILKDMANKLGHWSHEKREICLSRGFVLSHAWSDVREVLLHEMAHQLTSEALNVHNETSHGASFHKACKILKANPKATGAYVPLSKQISQAAEEKDDKIRLRIQKLMALAASSNRNEAEAAMIKAHELMKKYETEHILENRPRDYFSAFAGKPALRHFREDYALAHLLMDYYFVKGLWVPAYVLEKGKTGRVLELSGTAQNLQMAGYVFDFICQFIESEWKIYNFDCMLNRQRKTDFASGILSGFRTKIEQESTVNKNGHTSLSLVKIEDYKLKQYFSARHPNIRTFRRGSGNCHPKVMSDGAEIGKTLVIRKGITRADSDHSGRFLE